MSAIPAELLRPIVRDYLDKYDVGGTNDPHGYRNRRISPLVRLAEEANVHERRLRNLMAGTTKTVEFSMADSLLCAMGLVFAWYAKPLSDYYWTIDLGEKNSGWGQPQIVPGEKFPCGHERTLENCRQAKKEGDKVYWSCRRCHNAWRRSWRAKQKAQA